MVMMLNEILDQPEVLKNCLNYNSELINEVVKEIRHRKISSVVIAARGTSDHAGIYGKYIIESTIGVPVAMAAPSIFTVYKKQMDLSDSLIIGISQSGKAADVLEVIKGANNCGAITIAITNNVESPLAKEAKYHLYCNAGIEKSVAATKTFTSEMYLLTCLVAEWADDSKIKSELSEVPDNISKIFNELKYITEKVERYRFMNECFVLARGINYAIALESALKIQETSYVRAKAYATSDFHHGPFAMIQKDMTVLVYAPEGPSLNNTMEMIHKLKGSDAEIITISNNKQVQEMGNTNFVIPETSNDLISPFYNIVIAQLFACKLSLVKGFNPDAPRGLSKVTITK